MDIKKTTDEMVAKYISRQISETDKDHRVVKKLSSLTALIGAIATLLGAFSAWNSSNNADETAKNVEILLTSFQNSEKIKDFKQGLLDENGALLNLYNEENLNVICEQVPLSNTYLWNQYEYCIMKNSIPGASLGDSDIDSETRAVCGKKLNICKEKV